MTVSNEDIAAAILYMLERNKTLVEGAGASALAGLFKHNESIKSRHCGIIVSGGNMDIGSFPMIQRLADTSTSQHKKRSNVYHTLLLFTFNINHRFE